MPIKKPPNDPQRAHDVFLHYKDLILESNKGAVDLAVMALKTAILINGAAAVALLAFISQVGIRNSGSADAVVQLMQPLGLFVAAVFCGALATGLGYLRMYFEGVFFAAEIKREKSGKPWMRLANLFQIIAIGLVISSYSSTLTPPPLQDSDPNHRYAGRRRVWFRLVV